MYYLFLLKIFLGVMAIYLIWQLYSYFKKRSTLKKIEHMAFPKSYSKILKKIVYYQRLPDELKQKIHKKILFFIETKEFIGVHTKVNDEMRVVVAFFASMMVVNIADENYDELVTILIYPRNMIMQDITNNHGIYSQERFVLQGQSSGSVIVIAWDEAKKEAYHLRNHNVIIHELAHVLDFEEGSANGVPLLERSKYDAWSRVMYRRFSEINEKVQNDNNLGVFNMIGEYASTNEAEFFAVVSELFFQNPKSLKKNFPDLYSEFSSYYRLNPVEYV
jgi:Mlc titration factor MtfA (ptsG expression regulator)